MFDRRMKIKGNPNFLIPLLTGAFLTTILSFFYLVCLLLNVDFGMILLKMKYESESINI